MNSPLKELADYALGSKDPKLVELMIAVINSAEAVRVTSGNICVDPSYMWQPMATIPSVYAKCQLYTGNGVALYGTAVKLPEALAWAPLPKIPDWLQKLRA